MTARTPRPYRDPTADKAERHLGRDQTWIKRARAIRAALIRLQAEREAGTA